jgi:hypothetical protein
VQQLTDDASELHALLATREHLTFRLRLVLSVDSACHGKTACSYTGHCHLQQLLAHVDMPSTLPGHQTAAAKASRKADYLKQAEHTTPLAKLAL